MRVVARIIVVDILVGSIIFLEITLVVKNLIKIDEVFKIVLYLNLKFRLGFKMKFNESLKVLKVFDYSKQI